MVTNPKNIPDIKEIVFNFEQAIAGAKRQVELNPKATRDPRYGHHDTFTITMPLSHAEFFLEHLKIAAEVAKIHGTHHIINPPKTPLPE